MQRTGSVLRGARVAARHRPGSWASAARIYWVAAAAMPPWHWWHAPGKSGIQQCTQRCNNARSDAGMTLIPTKPRVDDSAQGGYRNPTSSQEATQPVQLHGGASCSALLVQCIRSAEQRNGWGSNSPAVCL